MFMLLMTRQIHVGRDIMSTGIFIFVVVIYIFSPNLNFFITSRPNSIDKQIDYTALENLLSSDKFQEADQESRRFRRPGGAGAGGGGNPPAGGHREISP